MNELEVLHHARIERVYGLRARRHAELAERQSVGAGASSLRARFQQRDAQPRLREIGRGRQPVRAASDHQRVEGVAHSRPAASSAATARAAATPAAQVASGPRADDGPAR